MNTLTRDQLVEWAREHAPDMALYLAVEDFTPDDDWGGSVPGEHGGEIHLIAQTDSACIYGETTDDPAGADYLIMECYIIETGSALAAVRAMLDLAFGSQDDWPDNYALTRGWRI